MDLFKSYHLLDTVGASGTQNKQPIALVHEKLRAVRRDGRESENNNIVW